MGNIDFGNFLAALGIIGGLVTLSVGLSTLLTRRDGKIVQSAKMESALTDIKTSVSELRIEVKTGFKDVDTRLSRLETDVGNLKGRVDMQEKSISRAHERLDEIKKG